MITLMVIFYAFLIPIHKPTKTSCQDNLKKLNYTFKYKEELVEDFYYNGRFKEPFNDSLNQIANQIKPIFQCFNEALKSDTTKILLISRKTKLKGRNTIEKVIEQHEIYCFMNFYDLDDQRTFFKYQPNQQNEVVVELINSNDYKIKSNELIPICRNCPF